MENSALLEMFERADLVTKNEVNIIRFNAVKKSHLIDILKQTMDVTLDERITPVDTIFSHSASMSLGGARTPCSKMVCRKRNLQQLVQFASLYSDRVYIENLFTARLAQADDLSTSEFKSQVFDDLQLLLYIRPMLDAGIIVPITSKNTCNYCLANNDCGHNESACYENVMDYVFKMYDERVAVYIEKVSSNIFCLTATGPEELIIHGGIHQQVALKSLPAGLRESDFLQKLKKNRRVVLPDEFKFELNFQRNVANEHLDTIRFEVSNAKLLRSSYLSDMDLHVDILNKFFSNAETQNINSIVQKHMTTMLPFIQGLSVKQVIDLRKNEEESFILFRKAFNDAIRTNLAKSAGGFTEKNALEIYSEFIQPELAKLDRTFKNAERILSKGIIRKLVSLTGALSFGFFQGFIPKLSTVAGPLLTQISGLQEWAMTQSDSEETIRNENMYFLWKVMQKTKH